MVLTDSGFKVLELNVGSAIGGYEGVCFEEIIRKTHTPLLQADTADHYHSVDMITCYFEFLVDQVIENVAGVSEEINFFIHVNPGQGGSNISGGVTFFNDFLVKELKKRNKQGKAYAGNTDELKLVNKGLYLNGKRMHGVITMTLNKSTTPHIFRSFINDHVYYPDHLGAIAITADKRNLALIRELATTGKLSEQERDLVLKYVPWTEIMQKNKTVNFRNETFELTDLLKSNKDSFVIKDANGSQGDNVFIGKYLSQSEWETAIQKSLGEKPYIAQEFTDSLDFLGPNIKNDWVPHKLIWGAFGFGDTYGGVFIRMSESEKSNGVINTAIGAVEAIVYEIE